MVVPSKWSGDFLGLDNSHLVRDGVALDDTDGITQQIEVANKRVMEEHCGYRITNLTNY